MSRPPNRHEKRKHIRFPPTPDTVAWLQLGDGPSATFTPQIASLVFSESHGGCGIILLASVAADLPVGARVRVKLGRLSPMVAEIRWKESSCADVAKLGLAFQE